MTWKSVFGSRRNIRRRRRTTVITEALEDRVLLAADIEWALHATADGAHPNANEQQLLWLINDARANPTEAGQFLATSTLPEIADDRAAKGVDLDKLPAEFAALAAKPPLTFDARLYDAAKTHADDLIARDTEDDTNQISRITDAGYDFSSANGSVAAFATSALNAYAGVNIDWDMNELDGMQVGRPDRANQMSVDTEFTNVGFAVVEDNDPSTNVGPLVVVQNFAIGTETATDHFNQFITGTVWDDLNDNGMYDPTEGISGVRVTPDTGDYFAITSAGGGYSIPVTEPGNWTLSFSNGITATKSVTVNTTSELVDVERGSLAVAPEIASQQFQLTTANATAGASAGYRWQLVNTGTADAGTFRVDFFLSRDDQFDPEDVKVAEATIGALAANGGTTAVMDSNFTLPLAGDDFWTGDGNYRLIMEIDATSVVTESNETNNIVSSSNSVSVTGTNSTLPDLTGGSLTTLVSTAPAGSDVNYTWAVANKGNSAAGEFFVDFYISEDDSFDPGDQQLARQTVTSLAAKATTGGRSVTLTLPATGNAFWTGNKPYFVIMDIDPADAVAESNDTNNFVSSATSLDVTNTGSVLAELVGSRLTISPTTAVAGDQITLQWQVNNTGGSASGTFTVDFYISQDGVNDPMDKLIGTASASSIAASGNSGLQNKSLNLPPGGDTFWSGDGPYRILMEIDADAVVSEINENNNFFASSNSVDVSDTDVVNNPITLDIDGDGKYQPLVDGILAVRYLAGFQGASLIDGVIGSGSTRATSAEIVAYLEQPGAQEMLDVDGNGVRTALTDGILTIRYLAGFTGDSLISGAVSAGATRTTSPQIIGFLNGFRPAAGPVAGARSPKADSDQRPDLTNTTLEIVPPLVVNAGDTVSVNWNAVNIGDANAAAFQVSFFLSNNNSSDPADLLIKTETLTSLAANGGDTGTLTTTFTLPPLNDSYWSGDGDYFVIILLDDGNSLIEHDEDNNLRIAAEPFTVNNTVPAEPELLSGTFRPLTTAADAGSDIQFEWEVLNNGNASADGFRVNFFLSTDRSFNPGDKLLDFQQGLTVAGKGTTGVLTRTVTLPAVEDSFWKANGDGNYELLIVIDPTNVAHESNEQNNTSAATGAVNVSNTTSPKADLKPGSIEPVTQNAVAGETVQVNRNIVNGGVVDSGAFKVNYYLSQDASFGPGDELIGSEDMASISANGNSGTSGIFVTLPAAGVPFWSGDGQYTILAVMDAGADSAPGVQGQVDESDEGNNTIASTNLLTVTNTNGGSLDIDLTGTAVALTDGILTIRYLAGFTGTSLTGSAVDATGDRTQAAEILAYLDSFRPNLDIDDDGTENALTDGVLVIRYLAGFRGTSLINGVVSSSGGRQTAAEIESYLAGLMPPLT